MKKDSTLGNQTCSIPAFYMGQNAQGAPNHYETRVEATRLCKSGKAKSINRGKAILITGPRKSLSPLRESTKSGWKVVGQTQKRKPSGPGCPRYASV